MDELFSALQEELLTDTDPSGVPRSGWFWDELLSNTAGVYIRGDVPRHARLELSSGAVGNGVALSPQLGSFQPVGTEPTTLVGETTHSDLVVTPLSLRISTGERDLEISAWLAVTRGGQRWARLGAGQQRQLINFDDLSTPQEIDPLVHTLSFATRTQQRYLGLDLPAPEMTPIDVLTAVALFEAAASVPQSPANGPMQLLLQWRTSFRLSLVRSLLNISPAMADDFPTAALARLDVGGEATPHRLLSPGATAAIQLAVERVESQSWDDLRVEDLTALTGLGEREAQWWGSDGISLLCEHNTGGLGSAWTQAAVSAGPALGVLLQDAEQLGAPVRLPFLAPDDA